MHFKYFFIKAKITIKKPKTTRLTKTYRVVRYKATNISHKQLLKHIVLQHLDEEPPVLDFEEPSTIVYYWTSSEVRHVHITLLSKPQGVHSLRYLCSTNQSIYYNSWFYQHKSQPHTYVQAHLKSLTRSRVSSYNLSGITVQNQI